MEEHVRFIFERRPAAVDIDSILHRLRNRSLLLRGQATACMAVIALISIALIVFLATRSYSYANEIDSKAPLHVSFNSQTNLFSALEQRHIELSSRIEGYLQAVNLQTNSRNEVLTSKDSSQVKLLKTSGIVDDMRDAKREILSTLATDRAAMLAEVRKANEERDTIARESAERLTLIRLGGEAAFRVGAIVVSVYFMSILANIAKYWFRVADHLSAVADTLDTLAAANMKLDKGINALSPHPIDFQADEPLSLKTLKDLLSINPSTSKS